MENNQTTATHTRGPWLVNDSEVEALVDPENSDTYYAPICTLDDGWNVAVADANARLIAAAPELLAALEQCLPIIDAHRRAALGEGDIAAMNARAAIDKAKGGTLQC